jgi:hypothetical protein
LADLLLLITIVDECQIHPIGAFDRAAHTAGIKSAGNLARRLDRIEGHFGKLFRPTRKGPQKRSGVPNFRAAFLADAMAAIEQIYLYAMTASRDSSSENTMLKLKLAVFKALPGKKLRPLDAAWQAIHAKGEERDPRKRSRISRAYAWDHRIRKNMRRTKNAKPPNEPLSALPRMRTKYPGEDF